MTVGSDVKSCFSSIKSAEATLDILANKTQSLETKQVFEEAQQLITQVKDDLQKQVRSEEHTSELQSRGHLVCRLLLEKKKKIIKRSLTLISDSRATKAHPSKQLNSNGRSTSQQRTCKNYDTTMTENTRHTQRDEITTV